MTLRLSRQQHQQLINWAKSAGNAECCGIIFGSDGQISGLQQTINIAPDPTGHFEIDPHALIAAERNAREGGEGILGFFHSHPNGLPRPSTTDAEMAADDGRIWLIIAASEISAWRIVADSAPSDRFEAVALAIEG